MKLYLDDIRPCPAGWLLCRWPDEVINYIRQGGVTEISLDHDLGDDNIGTGYDVLLWIEEQVKLHDLSPPIIHIHTANPVAKVRMLAAVKAIQQ